MKGDLPLTATPWTRFVYTDMIERRELFSSHFYRRQPMFCSYCAYGQLPMDAPCCYVCGHSGPYSTQSPSVTRKGLPRHPGECPQCRSRHTTSGRDNLKNDIPTAILVSVITFGTFLLFFIPFLLARAALKYYAPNRYWCCMCKHIWDE